MNYTKPVCRGSWALGSACGKCERCEETRPHEAKVSAQPQLRDSLAQVQELKSCPFCGGQPKVGETNTGVPGMEDCGYAFVECCIVHAHSEESVEDAIEKWNTRHGAGDADRSAELTTAWMAGVEREREREAEDSARLDWLERHLVEVREPLRYGSAHMFYALQTNDEGEPYRSDLRARVDAARAGERG